MAFKNRNAKIFNKNLQEPVTEFCGPKYRIIPVERSKKFQSLYGELRGRCGGTYEDVVKSCLASYEEEPMAPGHLFWNVVAKLDTLRV